MSKWLSLELKKPKTIHTGGEAQVLLLPSQHHTAFPLEAQPVEPPWVHEGLRRPSPDCLPLVKVSPKAGGPLTPSSKSLKH